MKKPQRSRAPVLQSWNMLSSIAAPTHSNLSQRRRGRKEIAKRVLKQKINLGVLGNCASEPLQNARGCKDAVQKCRMGTAVLARGVFDLAFKTQRSRS